MADGRWVIRVRWRLGYLNREVETVPILLQEVEEEKKEKEDKERREFDQRVINKQADKMRMNLKRRER